MSICDTGLNFEKLLFDTQKYRKLRELEYSDSSQPLFNNIITDIIDKFNEISVDLCNVSSSLSSSISEFTPGSILFADTDGSITEHNSKLYWNNVTGSFYAQIGGDFRPTDDISYKLGSIDKRFADVYTKQTTTGGVFETGLTHEDLGVLPTGTVVVWKDGRCQESIKEEDPLVMGVIQHGKNEPLILGAEPILVTGKVVEGDYLVTSKKPGHCKGIKRGVIFKNDLFGKVIAQALESSDGESSLIKAMIRKM